MNFNTGAATCLSYGYWRRYLWSICIIRFFIAVWEGTTTLECYLMLFSNFLKYACSICRKSVCLLIGTTLLLSVTQSSCSKQEAHKTEKELLVYCGITMIKPISEIAGKIEQQHSCKITITKGGSGNLLQSIKVNQVGDLYLPGS
ncbi:MAG: substrate-binding domain-containing protein, partial [Desulfobacteraceae bacterium]